MPYGIGSLEHAARRTAVLGGEGLLSNWQADNQVPKSRDSYSVFMIIFVIHSLGMISEPESPVCLLYPIAGGQMQGKMAN